MQNVYTVGQVNSYIKNMFSQDFLLQSLSVKGEVSNCKYHSSGHIYFTLKDAKGTISCVMFAGNRSGLAFRLAEGMQVVVLGTIDVYERDGKYQLYAKSIRQDGAGALYERFEQLKRELEELGMFSAQYKKPIPRYAGRIGIVTAPTGAAVRDIINIATRRNPYVQLILYPAIVQGEAAAASIINGIHALENQGVDLMIVGRGGGSIEDLWAFNEECVAQAVFDCGVPVISAVGHETDTTIIDYVADLRAPTPSAAAELAVYDFELLLEKIALYESTLNHHMEKRLELEKTKLENHRIRFQYLSPANQLQQKRMYCMDLEGQLSGLIKKRLMENRHRMALFAEQLKGLSPLEKLSQGYAYVENEKGQVFNDIGNAKTGQAIRVYVKNGVADAKITGVTEVNYGA